MFYSQIMLSKKGALGIIWIAAHCHKKLKKEQVHQTNIISSVETILRDEVPTVTHRILAYLLLGVVRIYSKKVEYLADDCLDMLSKMKEILKGKRADIGLESLRSPYHSIALPERFELDAFTLEGLENQDLSSDHSVRSGKEITLADTRIDEIMDFHSYNKYYEGSSSHSEVHTPVKEVLSPHFTDIGIVKSSSPPKDTINLKMGLENRNKSRFRLDDRLEPMTFIDSEYVGGLHGICDLDLQTRGEQIDLENIHERIPSRDTTNLKMGLDNINDSVFLLDDRMEPMTFEELENEGGLHVGLENINKSVFLLDDRMEPMTFEELENEGGLHGLSEKEIQTGGEQINMENIHESRVFLEKHLQPSTFGESEKQSGLDDLPDKHTDRNNSVTEICLEEPAPMTKLVDKEKDVESEILQNPGVTSSESRVSRTRKDHHVSISVDVTPQSKLSAPTGSHISGEVLPDIMHVRTPAAKERKRITQKRKCCYDDQLVVPNEMFKCWLNDSSDLVCKRRKVPHTTLSVWEDHKISRLPGSFLEPLIPFLAGNSLDFRHLISERTNESGKGYQPASSSAVEQNQRITSSFKGKNQTALSLSREQDQTAPLIFEEQNQTALSLPEEQNQTTPSFPEEQNQTTPKVIQVAPSLVEERGPIAPEFQEVHGLEIVEPATPVEIMEKCRSPSVDETFELGSTDEEMNSYQEDGNENNYLSVRARKVAGYLYRRFAHKKRGDEVIKLSQVVEGKTKKESARLFYEILVLKTKDYINVRQKNAYEDIQVMQTSALKQVFQIEG